MLFILLIRFREGALEKKEWKPGLFLLSAHMSLNGLLLGVFIIMALLGIDGSVAFPLRTIVNVLLVFFLTFTLFGEKVGLLEGVGAAVALTGIALVSSALA